MKKRMIIFTGCLYFSAFVSGQTKKVAQSGMTYLSISLSARESAMGNAGTAASQGVQNVYYNVGAITEVDGFAMGINQVNWIADTKIIGLAAAYSTRRYGTFALDLIYMDYGEIMGTRRVDKAEDARGYVLTGALAIEDYAIGLSYAYPVNDRFSFGGKVKIVHENLGHAPIAVEVIDQDNEIYGYQDRIWKLTHWGVDFGGYYKTGFKDLALGVTFQNYSSDMQYWREAFQMPLVLKMGLAMNIGRLFMEDEKIQINSSLDLLHPIDYTERMHVGAEVVYADLAAFRLGYQFNHDVENFSAGFGLAFDYQGVGGTLDYAYTNAAYFENIHRFSLGFHF
ncbi:PorV/PorQ family protein [candidate division KSB1 bacterium]|nr:PorV/PorQ family protein [candidate division KSB1 bacterium]RQW08266.1 MAG: PorV/PorQ family protein [candidate division KSB1 bacterium]